MSLVKIITLLLFLSIVFESCENTTSPKGKDLLNSGVVITFDDHYVDDWIKADSIYSQLGWKATFCITHFPELSDDYKSKLLVLQDNGNEIAFHGTHHENAVQYLKEHTQDEYLSYEIIPGLFQMREYGFNISSFAYPYGARSEKTDRILLNCFSIVRGTSYLSLPPEEQKCFSVKGNERKLVYAIGIDSHYEHMRISYIDSLLQYALDKEKIVLFYGHHIKEEASSKYITEYSTLDYICNFVNSNHMKFYTLSELVESGSNDK